MNRFEFVAVLPANTVEHVRTIVVSDCRKFSRRIRLPEVQRRVVGISISINQPLISDR